MKTEDRVVLITGATDGVGRLVARRLASQGVRVIAHGRDTQRGESLIKDLRAMGGSEPRLYLADFSSLTDVRRLAEKIQGEFRHLDVLINNAGIGYGAPGARRESSRDGYELRFAVNYLAPYLLTRLLLPLVGQSAPARIVNVASIGQAPINFEDVMLERRYDGTQAYRQSKLALVMFTFDLANELAATSVTANCVHPATFMNTKMVRESGAKAMSTIEDGAEAILHLATGPDLEGKSGLFFDRMRPASAHEQAYDEHARERLRALTSGWVGLSSPEPANAPGDRR